VVDWSLLAFYTHWVKTGKHHKDTIKFLGNLPPCNKTKRFLKIYSTIFPEQEVTDPKFTGSFVPNYMKFFLATNRNDNAGYSFKDQLQAAFLFSVFYSTHKETNPKSLETELLAIVHTYETATISSSNLNILLGFPPDLGPTSYKSSDTDRLAELYSRIDPSAASLLKRGITCLEDGKKSKEIGYFKKAADCLRRVKNESSEEYVDAQAKLGEVYMKLALIDSSNELEHRKEACTYLSKIEETSRFYSNAQLNILFSFLQGIDFDIKNLSLENMAKHLKEYLTFFEKRKKLFEETKTLKTRVMLVTLYFLTAFITSREYPEEPEAFPIEASKEDSFDVQYESLGHRIEADRDLIKTSKNYLEEAEAYLIEAYEKGLSKNQYENMLSLIEEEKNRNTAHETLLCTAEKLRKASKSLEPPEEEIGTAKSQSSSEEKSDDMSVAKTADRERIVPQVEVEEEVASTAEADVPCAAIVKVVVPQAAVDEESLSVREEVKTQSDVVVPKREKRTKEEKQKERHQRYIRGLQDMASTALAAEEKIGEKKPITIRYTNARVKEDFEDLARTKQQGRIAVLLEDILNNPWGTNGAGRPERLSGSLKGYFSRRIDAVNRLVYRFENSSEESVVTIHSCKGHYTDS
ncbi:MAG: Addiction module toxin, Txe/YoeB family, partial [uncultured bacterium]